MSQDSVSSTASRIRQFGLYRTIDARADEFIKSSRRKQIRQGCACAAISTAITVTVVVSVILVYEYSIHSTLNKKLSSLPRWFDMRRNEYPTETNLKIDKKLDFHAATFELLPILFNAFNKNIYGNNKNEEHSTTSLPYLEQKKEPEINFQRKILTDAKNWFKMPLLKRNADYYKLSSLVYPKDAYQYSRYLRNIRKKYTEDRLLKYFDKMLINEKARKSKAYPAAYYIDFGYTDDPITTSNDTAKNKFKPMILNTQFRSKKRKLENYRHTKPKHISKNIYINQPRKENKHCTCPKNTGALLNKLIQSVHKPIPTKIYKQTKTKSESHIKKVTPMTGSDTLLTTIHPTLQSLLKFITIRNPIDSERVVKPTNEKVNKLTNENLATKEYTFEKLLTSFKQAMMSTLRPIRHTTIVPKFKLKNNQVKARPKLLSTIKSNTTNITSYLAYTPPEYNTTVILNKLLNCIPSKHKLTSIPPKKSTTDKKITHMMSTTVNGILKLCDNIPEASIKTVQLNNQAENKNNLAIHTNKNIQNGSNVLLKFISLANKNIEKSTSTEYSKWKTTTPDYKDVIVSLLSEREYEDYFQSTSQTNPDFENFDVGAFELLKLNNMIPSMVNSKIINKKPSTYNDNIEDTDTYISLNLPESSDYDMPGSVSRSDYENVAASNLALSKSKPPEPWRKRLNKLHMLRKLAEKEEVNLLHLKKDQGTIEVIDEDDYQEDYKQNKDDTSTTYNMLSYYNDTIENNSFEDNKKTSIKIWNRGKNYVEDSTALLTRPPYLDIQHSGELKPRESTDYDINLANNIFDLPNI